MPNSKDYDCLELAVEAFPLWVLPEPLAEFVSEAAQAIGCPSGYIAVPMLSVLGTAIGTRRRIQIKEGWREWPIVWAATVGPTGSAKSPGQEKAVEPLVNLQNKLLAEFEEATIALRFEKKARASDLRKGSGRRAATTTGTEGVTEAAAVDTDPSLETPTPHLVQVFTTDTTLEALNLCLTRNPHGIALIRDELTAWVLSMNEYKKGSGADRPHWQSMWNGSQIVVNRKNNPAPLVIQQPFVSVMGGLPPDMLGELCDERGREDGFIHRILFAFPDPVPRVLTDEGIRSETTKSYRQVFDKLRALQLKPIGDGTVTCKLPPDVFGVFQDWANEHYSEMESGPVNLRGPWAKLVTYCARLTLIIHLTRGVCGNPVNSDVDAESVSRAIALISYFKSHARRVYRHLYASAAEIQIAAAIEWLSKRPEGIASQRDFVTYRVAGVRNSQDAQAIFTMLEANGWGHIGQSSPRTGGPRTIRFHLDPRRSADRLQMVTAGSK